tara:strand:- start:38 stop:298 length:261 start_codon:yes stop_codon:yes gene_type:complete
MSEKDPKKEEIKKDYRTKSQKFRELAEKRVNKVLTGLRLIENLSNKNNYAYTNEEVNKMIREIETGVRNMKARFNENGASKRRFRF